jgi:hypothetical protein
MSRARKITIFPLILAIFCAAFFHGALPVRGTNTSIFTISAWVKPSGSAASKAILGKAEELRIATNGSSQPICQIKSSSTWQTAATSSAAISVGSWSHVACTYDLAYVRIFVNGVEKGSQALAVAADDTAAVWKIGRDDSGSTPYGYFGGQVDEFKFYTSALTPEQIAIDMNQGKSLQLGGQTGNNNGTAVTGAAAEYCVPGDTSPCNGPVGEWKFDEKTGGTANDTSGNGFNGSFVNTPTWARGKFGSSLNFGSGNYLSIPDNSALRPGTGDFTAGVWVKTPFSETGSWPNIFLKGLTTTAHAHSWGFYGYSTNLDQIGFSQASNAGGSFDLTLGTPHLSNGWHHIIARRSGTTTQLYVDGVYTTQSTNGGSDLSASDNIYIGGNSANTFYFIGQIDQPTYYNYARTPAQIAWDYNRGKPVGHWKFEEGEGISAYDSSGNSNTGTLTTMDPPNDWVAGKFGKGLDFDGTSDYVISASTMAISEKYFSTSAWFKTSGAGKIISLSGSEHLLEVYNHHIRGCYINNCYEGTTVVDDGQWHFASVVGDSTNIKGYLDGKSTPEFTLSSGSSPITANVTIGKSGGASSGYFPGQIDDVRIYNYALTAEQVKQVMNEGGAVRFGD